MAALRFDRVMGEWRGNPRLRWGVGIAAAIAMVYAALALNDWRVALHRDYQQATLRLYKVAALSGKQEWIARAQEAASLRKALEAQVPQVSSSGMAQADMQGWVKGLLNAFGREMNSTAQEATPVGKGEVWKVPVTVRGTMTTGQLVEMLRRIESSERLIVVEALNVDNRQRTLVTMTITGFYRLPVRHADDGRG